MAVPKKRVSKQRQRKRRTHYKASKPTVATCSRTGDPTLRHRVCPTSGIYRGKQIYEVEEQ
ncbi:MAG: 50S ribosomal protein L32 [Gemmatimonadetes bacterium]|nr:50S ribosomal protein L32 [Gemmatimonadota bacterium]